MGADSFEEEAFVRALPYERARLIARRALRPLSELDLETMPVEEFVRRSAMPVGEDTIEGTRELAEWFLRRYPTARERFAYVRRARARVLGGPPRGSE